jgi:hypothetical protein
MRPRPAGAVESAGEACGGRTRRLRGVRPAYGGQRPPFPRNRGEIPAFFPSFCSGSTHSAAKPREDIPRWKKWLIVPGELLEVGFPTLVKSVPTLFGFVSHVAQACGFTRKHLLAHHAVVGEIEAVFEHPHRSG